MGPPWTRGVFWNWNHVLPPDQASAPNLRHPPRPGIPRETENSYTRLPRSNLNLNFRVGGVTSILNLETVLCNLCEPRSWLNFNCSGGGLCYITKQLLWLAVSLRIFMLGGGYILKLFFRHRGYCHLKMIYIWHEHACQGTFLAEDQSNDWIRGSFFSLGVDESSPE